MRAPPTAFKLRAASRGEAPFLIGLGRRAFAEYDPQAERTVKRMLSHPSMSTLVAEQRGEAVGFVIVEREEGDRCSVAAIAVRPAERGQGIGERLMRAAERNARARGAKLLTLTTAQANVAALSLFLRLGFRIVSRYSRYHGAQPACGLQKALGTEPEG